MQSINAYLLALTLCVSGVATADHKDNHPPPTEGGTDLSDLLCAAGQTVAFNGTAWECADFPPLTGLERVVDLSDPTSSLDDPDNPGRNFTATQEATATCPSGKKVVGGGYYSPFGGSTTVPIRTNIPNLDRNAWIVDGTNFDGTSWRLAAVAMCADAD